MSKISQPIKPFEFPIHNREHGRLARIFPVTRDGGLPSLNQATEKP